MTSIVRLSTLAVALALLLGALAGCTDSSPTAVAPDARSLTTAEAGQNPEDELLGGLFSGASPLTPAQAQGWTATLSHQAGKGCIYKAGSPNSCGSGSSSMAVLASLDARQDHQDHVGLVQQPGHGQQPVPHRHGGHDRSP